MFFRVPRFHEEPWCALATSVRESAVVRLGIILFHGNVLTGCAGTRRQFLIERETAR